MHSRILQISTKPIPKDLLAKEYDIPDWFTNDIADYVDRIEDEKLLDNNYHWVLDDIADFDDDTKSFVTDPDKINEIIDKKLGELKKLIDKLKDITTKEKLLHELRFVSYEIKDIYEDRFGFYVLWDNNFMTLDEFMYDYVDKKEKFYVGSIFDYHY